MQQSFPPPDSANAIQEYFSVTEIPTHQQTLGAIVAEILNDGCSLNRNAICSKLLARLESAESSEHKAHFNELISIIYE